MALLTQSQSLPDQEELEGLPVGNASGLAWISASPKTHDPLTLAFVMGYDTRFWFAENGRRPQRSSCSQVFRRVALATQPALTPLFRKPALLISSQLETA